MADVAGLLASAIVTQVGAKLGSVIGNQVSMLCCFEDDMEDMKATLESMEAALEDAEKRSIKEKEVRLWLKRLKNAALDISDMIDQCHTNSKQTDGKVTGIFSCLDTATKITVANKMKKMRGQLKKIKEDHLNFKFEPYCQRVDNDHQFIDRETTSMINKADIMGRDIERQRVIESLSASNNKEGATILPIFGLGGIGKTTLAQLVFSDIHFQDYDHRVWVYVSQDLDMKRVGNTIISQVLKEGRHDGDNMEFINRRIQELLDEKKTLIILDDLWENEDTELKKLKLMLNVSSKMKVLVTTRDEDIANRICTITPFRLSPLNNDMCWDIIKKNARFESREDKQQLEQIGQAIACKCGGVPLAAQALGSMLSGMDEKHWNEVSNNDIWNGLFAENPVLPSLKLSYIAMPPNLRLCFAYCAIFPRGHSISKDNLIHQWIALDFIKPSNMFSNLQLGDKYFGQLLRMSFLQHSKLPMTPQRSSVFTMHDLVYDLARSVMDEELIVYNAEVTSLVDSKYRLYASLTDCSKPLRISTILPAKLRALLFQNCSNLGITGGSFSFAKCLRVLDLTESSISRFPSSIGQLKHLRFLVAPGMENQSFPNCITGLSKLQYLNIHGSSQVSPRPESLGKLEHLMYLDLSGCSEIVELPERSLENLKNLVHLELSTCSGLIKISEALCYLTKLQYLNLSGCPNLERLPQDLGNLTELQYLYLSGCQKIDALPESIGKLINLVHLDLSRCSFVMPKALGDLTKLKYLSLSGVLDERKAKKTIDNISTLANLEHLDLSWNSFGGILPKSIGDLKSLHTLDLSGCRDILFLPYSIGLIESLELLLVDECSELLKATLRRSGLKCNPLVPFIVRRNKGDSASNLHELQDKNPLELEIFYLERLRVRGEASAIQLHNKENLSTLKLWWTNTDDCVLEEKDVLGELAPPSGLKHLVLIGYGSITFPNWLMNIPHYLPNLVSVQLGKLLRCTSLPPLGQLPNLKDLYLEDMVSLTKISGDDLCAGKRAFPQLSRLTLHRMNSLEEWNTTYRDKDGRVEFMFPVLHELVIQYCPRLRLKPCPPLFHRWEIIKSHEVLNFREECDKSAAPRTTLLVSSASYCGSWSLLSHLSTLEELKMELLTEDTLPESMRQLVSLRSLVLSECENIILPEWLGDLKSLQTLRIVGCQTIKSMPSSIQQLTELQQLHITSNTELQKWCQLQRNEKLAHIKHITCFDEMMIDETPLRGSAPSRCLPPAPHLL